jgi:hypothetical protein
MNNSSFQNLGTTKWPRSSSRISSGLSVFSVVDPLCLGVFVVASEVSHVR